MDALIKSQVLCLAVAVLLTHVVVMDAAEKDNYILINEEKTHFACKTKEAGGEYRLLPISKLCNSEVDCLEEADETTDGCKRKEKILVQTLDDNKKLEYISEFRAAVGRAVDQSGQGDDLKELLRQYKLDHYITDHDTLSADDMNKVK